MMTADDLKQVFQNLNVILGEMKDQLTPTVIDDIVALLTEILNDSKNFNLLLAFAQLALPNMTADVLTKDIQAIIVLLQAIKQSNASGSTDKLISFTDDIQNRNFVLRILSRML